MPYTLRAMPTPTVAQYTLQRLAALGIDRVFGVPGDYAFSVDDAAEFVDGLDWVACANELNAAYAADGYARVRGAAILSTTYGVGELSALNGVMGAKAHRLPVFHIVGMPSERIQHLGLITHHNLGDTRYDRFQEISSTAACVSAVLTPDNCIDELERVIREALRQSRPAYIVISQVNGQMPVIGRPVRGAALAKVKRQQSNPAELAAAVAAIVSKIAAAQHPVATITALAARYGVADKAAKLLAKANLPVAITPYDKGVVDESMPQYIGLYNAASSQPAPVRDIVESADLILAIGGVLLTELNTGFWGDVVNTDRAIVVHDNWVRIGTDIYLNVAIADVLDALIKKVKPRKLPAAPAYGQLEMTGAGAQRTSSDNFYPRLQRRLKAGDTLIIETGTSMFHLNGMRLPAGVDAQAQGLWGSIGWATPAALLVALAKKAGRTWLVTGDGSHQMTLNELAVMGRYGVKPVIFVLNNGLYGVEEIISERGNEYNELAPVDYHLLPEAFGCTDWLTAKVTTVAELDQVLDEIDGSDGAAYVEVMIPDDESQPLPDDVIDRAYKLQTPR
jgi:indolepyruvate decarboxylase